MRPQNAVAGDWFMVRYGFEDKPWYVVAKTRTGLVFGNPEWLADSIILLKWHEISADAYIARTKKRWWWKFLPMRNAVSPYPNPLL